MRTPSLRFKLILLLPALLVFRSPLFAQLDPTKEFRLPHTAFPTDYKLDLTIRPSETAFKGVATINIELKERTRVIWLNAKDLSIKEIHVKSGTLSKTAIWRTSGEFLAVAPALGRCSSTFAIPPSWVIRPVSVRTARNPVTTGMSTRLSPLSTHAAPFHASTNRNTRRPGRSFCT